MNCDENQDKFFTKIYEKHFKIGNDEFDATFVDATLRFKESCNLFVSCEKSPILQSIEMTKRMNGFFKFFGEGSLSRFDDQKPDDTSCLIKRSNWL